MHTRLLHFITSLRQHGLPVSTAESLDAMRALTLTGYADRSLLRDALALTLAKSEADKKQFALCFELFFGHRPPAPAAEKIIDADDLRQLADDESVREALTGLAAELLGDASPTALQIAIAAAMEATDVRSMRFVTQLGQYTRRTLQALGAEALDESQRELAAINSDSARRASSLLRNRQAALQAQVRDAVQSQFLLTANVEGRQLRERSLLRLRLSALDHQHLQEMRLLVQQLAARLARRYRRRRRHSDSGRLNMGKTLRRNVRYDSVLIERHFRRRQRSEPKLFALCDLSQSVAAHARFLLLFLYSLSDLLPKMRSFAFSNRLGEVSELFRTLPVDQALEQALRRWGQGGSDYGRSLLDFNALCLDAIDRRSTVLILGDARNNRGDARHDQLQKIYQRAHQVLWLNPEQRALWGTGDSEMLRYRSACHGVAECQSLQQLARVIDQLLRAGA